MIPSIWSRSTLGGAGLVKLDFVVTGWTVERAIALHMPRGPAWSATNSALGPRANGGRDTLHVPDDVELPYGVLGRVIGRFVQRISDGHVEAMLAKLMALAEA